VWNGEIYPKLEIMAADPDGPTILAVDDEPDLLDAIRRILTRRGYAVLAAGDADDAIALCRTHTGPIDLLLTDLRMPGTGGRELAAAARQARPGLPVLYPSGLADSNSSSDSFDAPVVGKPFTPTGLADAVDAALSAG